MNRRSFVRYGSLAAFSVVTWQKDLHTSILTGEPDRFELNEVTIDALQRAMASGKLTAAKITRRYLDRIKAIDQKGPVLRSVIEINPDAEKIARTMDEERAAGKVRGPLHGIPVLIKDNIDTADKMQTTAGSVALEGNVASKDAFIVRKLREAGAVILGKTNLSEFANFRSTRSVSGWSSRGGQTKNPYVLDRSPCGSSSGSGVAVAANLCVVAIGTETNGSIACPASMNGVVGIKPTVGLLSRSGIIPISATQDTPGPFARTVKDAAILLGALTGIDPSDPVTSESKDRAQTNYTSFLQNDALKGKRIGVEKKLLKKHEAIDKLFQQAIDDLKKQGAIIVEGDYMEAGEVANAEGVLLRYEFKDGLNKYLAQANAKVKTLQDVIDFNEKNAARAMPGFKQETLVSAQAKGDLETAEYKSTLAKIIGVRARLTEVMDKQNLDAVCGPATGPSWCIDPVNGDFWTGYGAYGPAAIAGFPSITVPMGEVDSLPVGLSFTGRPYSEGTLIGFTYAYEQVSRKRKPPKFIPSLKS